ncbi:hypothetical protein BDP81DRAFT_436771 [Colletotrichum phormii]|uniref:Uncharacterized protein n=1 Tax=Colletotrichum phormii TaxID=359342 RepID=A0AAJ0EAB8_9PEZI|nr:uncharacterized protein BDP81DRAFT_436771 [Colletotrichum phormii]KAK1624929.1 hypothetical protein BDP81DRAFT_436771 [Colletotrichum phormii]
MLSSSTLVSLRSDTRCDAKASKSVHRSPSAPKNDDKVAPKSSGSTEAVGSVHRISHVVLSKGPADEQQTHPLTITPHLRHLRTGISSSERTTVLLRTPGPPKLRCDGRCDGSSVGHTWTGCFSSGFSRDGVRMTDTSRAKNAQSSPLLVS